MKVNVLLAAITAVLVLIFAFVGYLYFMQLSTAKSIVTVSTDTVQDKAEKATPASSPVPVDTASPTSEGTQAPEPRVLEDTTSIDDKTLRITAVGDILLGRTVKLRVEQQKSRYLYPFEKVAGILKKGDIVFGNLEEPITGSTKGLTGIHEGGKYVLKNEIESINGLKYAGFNIFSLANNHILDYYEKGLFETIKLLDKNGIAHAGAGKNLDDARKLSIVEKNGLKVGFLAYTDMSGIVYKGSPNLRFVADEDKSGVAPTNKEYILEDIKKARQQVDILAVSIHWGVEYTYKPTSEQVELAHAIIRAGVDLILGHHAHHFQAMEIYKGKPIIYSMGNFIFDQNDPANQEGFIVNMDYKGKKLSNMSVIPFKILNKSRIVPQKGNSASVMLEREMELCKGFNTNCHIEHDRLVFDLD